MSRQSCLTILHSVRELANGMSSQERAIFTRDLVRVVHEVEKHNEASADASDRKISAARRLLSSVLRAADEAVQQIDRG